MKEATKNFFVCGVLMIIVGIAMIALSKMAFGIGCIVLGVIFLGAGFIYLKKDMSDKKESEES